MESNFDMVDVSDVKKKDRFIKGVYISLIVLVLLSLLVYFFGYELLKPLIRV